MSKRGRPRKQGERDGAGRLKQLPKGEKRANIKSVVRWQRAREIIEQMFDDTRLDSPAGKMLIMGIPERIRPHEFEAFNRAAEAFASYRNNVLGCSPNPKAQDIDGPRGRALVSDQTVEGRAKFAARVYMDIVQKLGAVPAFSVNGARVAVRNQSQLFEALKALIDAAPSWQERRTDAIAALRVLVDHWRLEPPERTRMRSAGEKYALPKVENRVRTFVIHYRRGVRA